MMDAKRIEFLNDLITDFHLYNTEENNVEKKINTLNIGDIDYIIEKVYSVYPSDRKTYKELYYKCHEELHYKYIYINAELYKLLDTRIFYKICLYLNDYDVFKYLFEYLLNNKEYVITIYNEDVGIPVYYMCYNNNLEIFNLYLNYMIIHKKKHLHGTLFYNLHTHNKKILKRQLDIIVEYDLSIWCDAAVNDHIMSYLETLDNEWLEYFIQSMMQLSDHKEIYRYIKILNKLERLYNQDKKDLIIYILDNAVKSLENSVPKSAI